MIINENTKIGETKADYISVNLYLIRSIELSYPNNFQKKKKKLAKILLASNCLSQVTIL